MQESIYIGIGASAGGLGALEKLVSRLPTKMNYVYIIAQHLSPNKNSLLSHILSKSTDMPVEEATMECKFSSNHIYVIPPSYNLSIKKHRLTLEKNSSTEHTTTPSVDKMLESIALYKKNNCVGIILTGAGHDGTLGIRKVKESGGLTIAQSPLEAEYESMPQSAIESSYVDYVFDLEDIADYLSSILMDKKYTQETDTPDALNAIRKILHERENLNIHKYKNETIIRRINKRMLLVRCETLDEYLEYLKNNLKETKLLYQDILIGVTSFFRDKEAFKSLQDELYLYLKDKPEGYELRVWSIACSTGEEAYSLAILISQISKKLNKTFKVSIFATDIDTISLKTAREAYYTKESLDAIDEELLHEYFMPFKKGYKAIKFLREQIIFSEQNLLSDPPFINQDIISCRNLLIYLLPEAQQEIFTLFHHSLKEHALLFLGSSESTLVSVKYFLALNSEHKIYKKEKLKHPPKISSHFFSKHTQQKSELTDNRVNHKNLDTIEKQISDSIFNFFAPNFILIDRDYSIVYKKGELPFVNFNNGFVTLSIIDNIHDALKYDLKELLNNAFKSYEVQTTQFVEVSLNSSEKTFVRVVAHPFNEPNSSSMLLLYFQELKPKELQFNTNSLIFPDESAMYESLISQLNETREKNHLLLDELSINKENMQLMNEELQSSNEELQSSNEELETSNEELQSSNEELHASILNIQKLQQQFSLILNSTRDGIIGLDLDGNHIFVNNAARDMLGFSENELIGNNGHLLWHHTKMSGGHYPFEECTQHYNVISGISNRTEELFWRKDGSSFEVEVLQNPIIEDEKIVGSVLSFHDISEKNRLKKIAQHEHQLADMLMNIHGNIVLTLDTNGNISMINEEGCNLLKVRQGVIIGKNFIENFIPQEMQKEIQSVFKSVVNKKAGLVSHYKNKIIDAEQQTHIIAWTNSFLKGVDGNITGVISSGIDITHEEELSKQLFEQEKLYKTTFEEADVGIAHISLEGMWVDTNEYLSNLLGYTKEEFKHLSITDITYPDDIAHDKIMAKELLDNKLNSYHIEKRYIAKNGKIIWVNLAVVLLKDEFNEPIYFLKIIRDISDLKILLYQLEIEKNKLKDIIEFTPNPAMLYNENGEIIMVNKMFRETLGYTKEEITDIDFFINNLYAAGDKQKAKNFYNKPFITNELEQEEQNLLTKSKEKRVAILNSIMLHNTYENDTRVVLTAMVDITDIQHKDEIMIAQSRQAAMGDMLAMIAHQWRQPLSVISLASSNIRANLELEENISRDELSALVKILDEQSQYLSTTIDDFKNFFKPKKEKENITISLVLDRLATLVQKSIEDSSIVLEFPINQDIELYTYPNQMIQVLINLINNAKDAIKDFNLNSGLINITIYEEENEIIISVCDNGGGIDKSVIDSIGQPYVSTKSKNGTGLGLYMSKIITEKYLNGRLYWENYNNGCCFYLALPKKSK